MSRLDSIRTVWRAAWSAQPQHMRLLCLYGALLLAGNIGHAVVASVQTGSAEAYDVGRLVDLEEGSPDRPTANQLTRELHAIHPLWESTPELQQRDLAVIDALLLMPGYGGLLWLTIRVTRRRRDPEPLRILALRQMRYAVLVAALSLDFVRNSMMVHALVDQHNGAVQPGFLLDAAQAARAKWPAIGLATALAIDASRRTWLANAARGFAWVAGGLTLAAIMPSLPFRALLTTDVMSLSWYFLAAVVVQACAEPESAADTQ